MFISKPMVSPNFCRICSNKPLSPPSDCSCRGGVSTFAGMPSDLAPGSVSKLSGEAVLPYSPQPIPMPSSTSTAAIASAKAPATALQPGRRLGLQVRQLDGRVVGLQVGDQRLQLAERGGVGGGAHPLSVFLHRQLSLGERAVEHLAGVVAVAVFRPGARCLPRRHVDDRKSWVAVTADQMPTRRT